MGLSTSMKLTFISLFLVFLTSCYKLQSDEELREDIIGTWKKEKCRYPFNDDGNIEAYSVLNIRPKLIFKPEGIIDESGTYAYCCSNACDTNEQGVCNWTIQDGDLIIIPEEFAEEQSHLNQPFPIKALKKKPACF